MSTSTRPLKKILIVEDEGDLCLLLELLLFDKDTYIDHAMTLADALLSLEKETPHIILLDNRLPDGLGLDLLPTLREKYPTVKIIMISGKDAAAADFALESGAHGFLTKPFSSRQLEDSIKVLLN
jgi:two-component system OmpR family response regulator